MRGARRSGSAQRRDGEASGPSSRWKWTPFLIIINYRPFNKDSQQEASFLNQASWESSLTLIEFTQFCVACIEYYLFSTLSSLYLLT